MQRKKWLFITMAVALLVAPAAFAQSTTGSLFVEATDTEGNPLPGVTISVSGTGADMVAVTGADGKTRFPRLDPGSVQMTATLDGFSTVEYPGVDIRVNKSTTVQVQLSAAVEEVITVTSESPLLDERKVQSGTTMTQLELEKIPSARDPWSVITQTPGVMIDRINVGGNESGQQSGFRSGGTDSQENDFLMDGVQITDMVASGGSATYFDFDQFTEMQFGTGGADVTKATAGVSVNLVTKRGTNDFRGSARFNLTDSDAGLVFKQSSSNFSQSDLAPGQTSFEGNKINKIEEWGFEAGGPVLRDKLWFWGSHGSNDIKKVTSIGAADDTILTNTAFKFNAQFSDSNSAVGSWNNGDKEKFGRNVSRSRPPDTAWNQRGPSAIIKFEDTHVFNSSFFVTGGWNKVDGGFELVSPAVIREGLGRLPVGAPQAHRNGDRVWEGSYLGGGAARPQEEVRADSSYFFNSGDVNHELKFGARLRETTRATSWKWSNDNAWSLDIGAGKNPALLITQRGDVPDVSQEYTSAWIQDTISSGNWTINAGLRYDLQDGSNDPFSSGANPWFPTLHPNVDFGGEPAVFDWTTISPRIGATYALGEERQTLLRASYSTFPEQLTGAEIARQNPAGESYITMLWYDTDGNGYFSGATLNGQGADDVIIIGYSGWDPDNPLALSSPNRTDPGFDPEVTTEILLGVEHALQANFVIGGTVTMRNTTDIKEFRTLITDASGVERTATAADYVNDGVASGTLPDGTSYSVPIFALSPDVSETGGNLLLNGDREVDYLGYGVNFNKRLSNQWMMRGYVQLGDADWSVPASHTANNDPTRSEFHTNVDGALFGEGGGTGSGAFENIFTQSSWQYNISGMYQVAPDRPWGFNLAGNLFGREGYPLPWVENSVLGSDGNTRNVGVAPTVDHTRADDIMTFDLRLDKEFATTGNVNFTVGIDVFNALNEGFVLQRARQLNSGSANFLEETLSPRVWRIGTRISWR